MKRHRNREVREALDKCINDKWARLSRPEAYGDNGRLLIEPECSLCELFYNNAEYGSCAGCPLHLMMVREGLVEEDDECSCGNDGTPYKRWSNMCKRAPSTRLSSAVAASHMRDWLLRTRNYFFGPAPISCAFEAEDRKRAVTILLRAKSLLNAHKYICVAVMHAVSSQDNNRDNFVAKRLADFIQQVLTDDSALRTLYPVSTLENWLHHVHGISRRDLTEPAMLAYRRECIDRMIHQLQTQGHISR